MKKKSKTVPKKEAKKQTGCTCQQCHHLGSIPVFTMPDKPNVDLAIKQVADNKSNSIARFRENAMYLLRQAIENRLDENTVHTIGEHLRQVCDAFEGNV